MIRYTQGNLLDAEVEAVVNTVNTVGVMGKGIALMFKEAFPDNFQRYEAACKAKEVRVGHMFVTERRELMGPKWIVNFPTKQNWRQPSKLEWVVDGLIDLRAFILDRGIRSIAIPPLGSGNGGLEWPRVRAEIEEALGALEGVDIVVYEPTSKYQNVAKRAGVQKLTPARALIAELVRRYWVLGMECSLLEIQKLAWFLERNIERLSSDNPLDLRFEANKFGPYANRLVHLLDALDGSYLHCDKRLADAGPMDIVWFDEGRKDYVQAYLKGQEAKPYLDALTATTDLIDGFESPLGMELLATVDWLLVREGCTATVEGIKQGLHRWPGGAQAATRKVKLFDDRLIGLALGRLTYSKAA
ncbi:MAG: Appr-1-p processing protein [Gammaproteobacteria bacterium RBG_16_57_12]|nr:MAG: Appr-1-p processing protein [Gammaproteobacteria bacterium RBG_16_57_12]